MNVFVVLGSRFYVGSKVEGGFLVDMSLDAFKTYMVLHVKIVDNRLSVLARLRIIPIIEPGQYYPHMNTHWLE